MKTELIERDIENKIKIFINKNKEGIAEQFNSFDRCEDGYYPIYIKLDRNSNVIVTNRRPSYTDEDIDLFNSNLVESLHLMHNDNLDTFIEEIILKINDCLLI